MRRALHIVHRKRGLAPWFYAEVFHWQPSRSPSLSANSGHGELEKFSGLALESCPPRWSLRKIITGNTIYLGWMVLATSWTLPGPPSFCMLANQSGECQGMPWTWSKGGRSSGPNQRLLGALYTDMARPNAYGIFPYVLELPRFISRWNHTEIHLDNATTLRLCCNHKQEDGKDRAWICP